ncbi:hypothetical protein BD0138_10530 [Helicobacter pylori]
MKTMNLNEFFTHKIIYKDTPLKFKDTLEQEISQASLVEKLILANILANMVFAKISNENAPKILISRLMCKFSPIDYESTIPSDFKPPKQKSQISLVFGMNALVPLGTI